MLYIIATPIGNLGDLSQRALSLLQECDLILCEDTRHSQKLFSHFGMKKPLLSYHAFNEKKRVGEVVEQIVQGKKIALISDAGTPLLNDPGSILIQACIERKAPFTFIPGPTSAIAALVLSGFSTETFQVLGFLPQKEKELRTFLFYPGTTIAFEGPSRLVRSLERLHKVIPSRNVAVVREITKIHEEVLRGTPKELLDHFQKTPPLGEMVLVIEQGENPLDATLEEVINMLQKMHGLSLKEAIRKSALLMHTSKRLAYQKVHAKSLLHPIS